MNQYKVFFDDLWAEDKRMAVIDGVETRILLGTINAANYASTYGVSIQSGSREITLVKAELPTNWTPKPDAKMTIGGKQYRMFQDVPVQELDPDGTLIKLTVKPV